LDGLREKVEVMFQCGGFKDTVRFLDAGDGIVLCFNEAENVSWVAGWVVNNFAGVVAER